MPKIKSGEVISWKEFFKRWKEGISNLTPEQKISNEARATFISLTGFIVSLMAIIIFLDKFIVNWFAYGLILIFVGSIFSNLLKYLSLKQQLRILKNQEKESININTNEIDLDKLENLSLKS